MKKYIPLVVLCMIYLAMTWTLQEGMKVKSSKTKSKMKDAYYTYTILSQDDWDMNKGTIESIITNTLQERCVVLYPVGTDPKKLFSFIEEEAPSDDPRVRLVIVYNKEVNVVPSVLSIMELGESTSWNQAMFIFAKGSDKITKKVGNITPL
jgi:hypothetical protein